MATGKISNYQQQVEYRGETKTISEWAAIVGINGHTLYNRIAVYKWTAEKALTTKPRPADHHGKSKTPEYTIWNMMIQRCTNENTNCFDRYGERGIIVCERWKQSFAAFFEDMGPRPSKLHQIDRKDNSLGYEPGNCHWATATANARNRRSNRLITWHKETKTMAEWSELTGISAATLNQRIAHGWAIERAMTEKTTPRPAQSYTWNGQTKTIAEWSASVGIHFDIIYKRLCAGWTVDRALTTKPQKNARRVVET